ncbi:putative chaperone DNAJ protein [Trypanosoma grayi]|uniref:putative chaperone DNAJ protein n=1 Tax=Trypanosoma grayi TaxID=71804 RepID=UPI0004F49776|nr:putative chaperone DNAJ protein [Trypanosoma grayi]KEG08927.1 putative chaperone DNAJ protein [Trypanosoma grayi]
MWCTRLRRRSALAVLGLDENARHTEEEVKAAFHRKVKKLHPDAGGSAECFRELRNAYDSLRHSNKGGAGTTVRSEGDDESSAFYNNAHSRWSADRDADGGLGAAFASDASSDYNNNSSSGVNSSTRDFYRPYTSNPFSHGFTAEEVQEAERRNRFRLARLLLKHGVLWGGLVYFLVVYYRENRIHRAIVARNDGYADGAYWAKLSDDHVRGLTWSTRPHWTDLQSEEFVRAWKRSLEQRKRAAGGGAGGGVYAARPVALTFQGRPFTATGVRGARSGVTKSSATYASDAHYEPDDMLDD